MCLCVSVYVLRVPFRPLRRIPSSINERTPNTPKTHTLSERTNERHTHTHTHSLSLSLQAKLKKKRMTKYAFDAATSRVVPLTDDSPAWGKHFGQADMVIEVRGWSFFVACGWLW